ncbi:YhdH/YhfP family quinone oxidoreductase [Aestuariibacter sp. A3R04]|uniref:YhdH/YhfP family quinone oxidoreductase n=1 Tax=Aestuariibacter sp. A3R04 TaxID=2841571 RepID=UPI001C0A1AED|nr:YhdH/YhfP family quinone oxidoreductase [Aestuariibacter sp. A3R04]MBU3020999.1 YhdH/YhfP family quinone oxidoreductase [Aestuariibacter sp. A3R04]
MTQEFTALLIEQQDKKTFTRRYVTRTLSDLPDGDVVIKVSYSSLNYKDALSATGNPGVSRNFPHTPGIDAAGIVESSQSERFKAGDAVLVTGYDLGMNTPGGFGGKIRVPAEWIVPLPEGLSAREAMTIGTAGFTAAMSVQALQDAGIKPDDGEILVTGATGGVGSVAVALLSQAGYSVVAVTGKADKHDFLTSLGASKVIERNVLLENNSRPMLKETWAGCVDCVGGDYLAAAIKSTCYGGAVTCCGLTASAELPINVFPFILRGVSLLGIDSVQCPMTPRLKVWGKLAGEWKLNCLDTLTEEIPLDAVDRYIDKILQGQVSGRVLVRVTD